jgi:hypothetical protein
VEAGGGTCDGSEAPITATTAAEGQEAAPAKEVATCASDRAQWLRLAGEVEARPADCISGGGAGGCGWQARSRLGRQTATAEVALARRRRVAARSRPTRVGLAGGVEDGRRMMAAQ